MIKLILVSYISRSGSTLFLNHLSKYSNICVCPEADILVKEFLYEPFKQYEKRTLHIRLNDLISNDAKLNAWNYEENDVEKISSKKSGLEIFFAFLTLYRDKNNPNATTIFFKAVEIANCYQTILDADTSEYEIKQLTILRDPRAVYNSQKRTKSPYQNRYLSTSPLITAYIWNNVFKSSIYYSKANPNSILIRFEDFLNNPKAIINGICKVFDVSIGKKIDHTNVSLYNRLPSEQKKIHQNVNNPIIKEKINEWKDYLDKNEKLIIDYSLCDQARSLYPEIKKPKIGRLFFLLLYYKFRIFFSIDKY